MKREAGTKKQGKQEQQEQTNNKYNNNNMFNYCKKIRKGTKAKPVVGYRKRTTVQECKKKQNAAL